MTLVVSHHDTILHSSDVNSVSRGAALGCRFQFVVHLLVHFLLFCSFFNLKCVCIFKRTHVLRPVQCFNICNAPESHCETPDNDADFLCMTGSNHVQNIVTISI